MKAQTTKSKSVTPTLISAGLALGGPLLVVACGGKSESAKPDIVGGEAISAYTAKGPAYRSTVAITNTSAASVGKSYCTGTLIDDKANLVISAAHCFQDLRPGESHYVFFGSSLATSARGNLRKVTRVVTHGRYDNDLTVQRGRYFAPSNDIAMLRFDGSVPPGFKATQVAGASEALKRNLLLAGFGTTGALQKDALGRVRLDSYGMPLTKSDTGTLRMVEVALSREYAAGKVFNVAGRGSKPQGACPGDSGGPVYAEVGSDWRVFGVLSTGIVGGADTDGDGRIDVGCVGRNTYTDVRPYAAWIVAARKALGGSDSKAPAVPTATPAPQATPADTASPQPSPQPSTQPAPLAR